jgi:lipid A 3-O-deacylase
VPGVRLATFDERGACTTPRNLGWMMMNRMRALLLAVLLLPPTARAVDGMSFEFGSSDSTNASVDMGRIGLQWNWSKRWAISQNWHIGGYWDVTFGHWSNDSPQRTNSSLTDFGVTPVLRLQQTNPSGVSPYIEGAVGFHLLSDTSVSQERKFGSSFQFGDHVGLGIRFGQKQAFDLGYRYQHLSNAGIKHPNQGINFHQVRLQYNF